MKPTANSQQPTANSQQPTANCRFDGLSPFSVGFFRSEYQVDLSGTPSSRSEYQVAPSEYQVDLSEYPSSSSEYRVDLSEYQVTPSEYRVDLSEYQVALSETPFSRSGTPFLAFFSQYYFLTLKNPLYGRKNS